MLLSTEHLGITNLESPHHELLFNKSAEEDGSLNGTLIPKSKFQFIIMDQYRKNCIVLYICNLKNHQHTICLHFLAGTPLQALEYMDPTWVRSLWWVWVIGLVWVAEFILACQQMIIASAVSTWYFSRLAK